MRTVVGSGARGVAVFFVISGYLITTLLLREERKKGTISLRRFYWRRTMRIFPPFYVFLAVMALLWLVHVIPEPFHLPTFLAAMTYTWSLDYAAEAHSYFLGHSWSLSIEELFYLVWPLVFLKLALRRARMKAAVVAILAMPLVRIFLYFMVPAQRGHEGYMVQGWVDTMMVGCLLALAEESAGWAEWRSRLLKPWTAGVAAVTAFMAVPYVYLILPHRMNGLFALMLSYSVTAVCIGWVLLYFVHHPNGPVGWLLNSAVVRHVGVISYSLYLWQQLFMARSLSLLPYGFVLALLAAELSFWLIEGPVLAWRQRVELRSAALWLN